ncbi:hypothetical protein SD53_12075 [Rheinheimera mesophila]|nr:hypothetical protein SD53_12075 [Rheinheimera mesophila]
MQFVHEGSGRWRCVKLPDVVFGLNEYGEYHRRADGLQMMDVKTAGIPCTTNLGSVFISALVTASFPVKFLSTTTTSVRLSGYVFDSNVRWLGFTLINILQVTFNHISAVSAPGNLPAIISAMGRWKPNV